MIAGNGKIQEKSEIRSLRTYSSQRINNVKSYILLDVLDSIQKSQFQDIVTNGIDMILYGETGKTKSNSIASKVSYRSYYDGRKWTEGIIARFEQNRPYNYDDIILDNRGEAEDVLVKNGRVDFYLWFG